MKTTDDMRPKRKPRKLKPRLPANMRDLGAKAIAKHRTRPIAPLVTVEGDEHAAHVASPYAPRDTDDWLALLYQASGTRPMSVMRHFIATLGALVKRHWDEKAHKWTPSEEELQTVIAMVNSMKPADEAQAAYSAMLAALYLSSIRMAKHTTGHCADA